MATKYFAYGSNMSEQVMHEKCADHTFLGPAHLPGFRLAFTRRSVRTGTGVADIVEAEGPGVWGALYELSEADLEALDRKEGRGWAYRRVPVIVRAHDGAKHDAFAYTVVNKQSPEVTPAPDYLEGLILAARQRGLPDDYVRPLELRRASISTGLPTPERAVT